MRRPEQEQELDKLDHVLVTRLDVQDPESIRAAVQQGIAKFEKIRRQFDTNVIKLMEITKAVRPHFRANRDGVIVNISSVCRKMTFPLGILCHGSKFAV